MTVLSQRDPKWGNLFLGTSNTYIKDYGCTITCIAMIVGTTPDVVNDRMKAVMGFANGNLVIWAKIEEAFPGIKINRVWTYDNNDVAANVGHVMVEVPATPIGGTGKHWVVYLGNQRLNDPWTGTERPTADFPDPSGYCILTGQWNATPTPTAPTVNITQAELDQLRKDRDTNYNNFIADEETIKKLNAAIDDKNSQISSQETEIKSLKYQLSVVGNDTDKAVKLQALLDQAINDRKLVLDAQQAQNKIISQLRTQLAAGKPTTFMGRLKYLLT